MKTGKPGSPYHWLPCFCSALSTRYFLLKAPCDTLTATRSSPHRSLSMLRLACALVLALGFAPLTVGQDKPKTGFVDKTFKNSDGTTSPYVVFVPHNYDGTKEYPVILFLHGAGETKNPKAKK